MLKVEERERAYSELKEIHTYICKVKYRIVSGSLKGARCSFLSHHDAYCHTAKPILVSVSTFHCRTGCCGSLCLILVGDRNLEEGGCQGSQCGSFDPLSFLVKVTIF